MDILIQRQSSLLKKKQPRAEVRALTQLDSYYAPSPQLMVWKSVRDHQVVSAMSSDRD